MNVPVIREYILMHTLLGIEEALTGILKPVISNFQIFILLCWSEYREKVSLDLPICTHYEASKWFNLNYCM